jgi:tol-pal system protein YbgF
MRRILPFALVLAIAGLSAIAPARAQLSESELVMRLNRLENQVRQLTGQVEQLQYRNSQLEQQLRAAQPAAAVAPPPRAAAAPQPQYAPAPQPQPGSRPSTMEIEPYSAPPPPTGGRRGDAFDPNQNPSAPGVPRTLGAAGTVAAAPPLDNTQSDEPPYVGAPGGRQAGEPLDLGIMAEEAVNGPPPRREVRQIPGALPAPPARNPNATGQQMVMAPTNSPKDEFDLAYGYVLRRDYALADDALRAFLKKYPGDRLAADANYWLGESLFQRQRYRDAAESFLTVSTKFDQSAKAPDSLLRLGQSLAALKEKEAACATLGEIGRKYPRASANVKQAAEREQKRAGC